MLFLLEQQCEYIQHYWIVHLNMAKVVNFTLCVFYHDFKKCFYRLGIENCNIYNYIGPKGLFSVAKALVPLPVSILLNFFEQFSNNAHSSKDCVR